MNNFRICLFPRGETATLRPAADRCVLFLYHCQEDEAAAAEEAGKTEHPAVKLRASDTEEGPAAAPAAVPSIGLRSEDKEDSTSSPDEECKSCDALDEDMKEAEDEGARLFAELKARNILPPPMIPPPSRW